MLHAIWNVQPTKCKKKKIPPPNTNCQSDYFRNNNAGGSSIYRCAVRPRRGKVRNKVFLRSRNAHTGRASLAVRFSIPAISFGFPGAWNRKVTGERSTSLMNLALKPMYRTSNSLYLSLQQSTYPPWSQASKKDMIILLVFEWLHKGLNVPNQNRPSDNENAGLQMWELFSSSSSSWTWWRPPRTSL